MLIKKKWTLFHTVSHRQWGGQERRIFNESRWMAQKGHRIIIAAPQGSPVFQKSAEEGWEVFPVGFTRAGIVLDFFKLRRILNATRPDVLNTHGNMDAKVGMTAAWGTPIPCVILSRHISPPVSNRFYNRMLYGKLCHRIFTTSKIAAHQIATDLGVPEERIHFIPSGISPPAHMMEREAARTTLAEKLGLPPETQFVGYVGRLSPAKGLSFLVDAFLLLKKTFPKRHLVFVGEGGMQPELDRQVRLAGIEPTVHFMGYQENPWPFYRAFECTTLPSTEDEGVAQVLLEAMFAKCPVVATDVGGSPDVVIHRKTGLLTPPKDASALSAAIATVLTDPALTSEITQNAALMVNSEHTIDTMGEKILTLYEASISGKAKK